MKSLFLGVTAVARLVPAAAVVVALGLSAVPARAQQPVAPAAAQRAPTGVAIIDLSYIFKNNQRFQAQLTAMKGEVEAKETQLRAKRDQIRQMGEAIKMFTVGTPDYRDLEAKITQASADLQVQVQLQKKEFLNKEAQIYYQTYRQINDAVRYYSERHGIALVLRFNGDTAENAEPSEVMQELNRAVVYNHPAVDITPVILDMLEGRTAGR